MGKRRRNIPEETFPRPAQAPVLWMIVIVLAALASYLPVLRAGYVWDDTALTDNELISSPGGLAKIWFHPASNLHEQHYWPMVYTTFWIEHKLWGFAPRGYHIVNVLLHAVNSLLLGLILKRARIRGAWGAAALFALHPVHVESVAWVIERKDVLSGFFYFLAAFLYLRFDGPKPALPSTGANDSPPKGTAAFAYFLSLGCFVLAMLSKSVAISLPAGIAILLWARDGKLQPRAILPLIPMFALAVAIGLLDARYSFGLSDYQSGLGAADRIALAGRAVWFYAGKCLWPSSLMTNYPRWDQIGSRAGDWIYPAACGFFPAMCWIARKRTALYPLLAALFFIITLSPTLGLIDYGFMLYSYVADRFQYLAAIGPMVLTCGFLSKCLDELRRVNLRRRPQPAAQFVLLGAGPILLSGLGVLTFHQAALYKDITALFSDNLNKHPKSWPSWYNVGYEFDKKGELETARQYYLKAVEFNPRSIDALDNLALALHKTGRPAEAIPYFNAALAIDPRDTTALNNLGIIALQQGNGPAAEDYFNRSLAAKPNHPSSLNNLGMLRLQQGRVEEAIEIFKQALAVKPDYPDALNNLANACLTQNKPAEAEKALRRAVAIEPRHLKCLYNLGMILLQSGRAAEAVEFLRRAAEVNPNYLEALNALGVGYAQLGQLGQAVEVFSRVLQINPNDPDAVKNLQMAQQRLNAASGDRSR